MDLHEYGAFLVSSLACVASMAVGVWIGLDINVKIKVRKLTKALKDKEEKLHSKQNENYGSKQ